MIDAKQIRDGIIAWMSNPDHPTFSTKNDDVLKVIPQMFAAFPVDQHPQNALQVTRRLGLDLVPTFTVRKVGTALYALSNMSEKAVELVAMNRTGRWKYFSALLTENDKALINYFKSLHANSSPNTMMNFLSGTADGLCPAGTPARIAEDSHIIDKFLSHVTGLPEFNYSANVLKECGDVNRARYGDLITTEIIVGGESPQPLRYVVKQDVPLPEHLRGLHGKDLCVPKESLLTYRKAFAIRELILRKLTPEHEEVLAAMKEAADGVEDSQIS